MASNDAAIVKAGVRVTHPDRVLFPDQGLSKADLVAHYEAVAEVMLPHIGKRPLSLVRCPSGSGKCFFQKHDTGGFPDAMGSVPIEEASGAKESYFYLANLAGLVAGVQMGVLEFHIWGSRIDAVEKPDRLVFDLDPGRRSRLRPRAPRGVRRARPPRRAWPAILRASDRRQGHPRRRAARAASRLARGEGLRQGLRQHCSKPTPPTATSRTWRRRSARA